MRHARPDYGQIQDPSGKIGDDEPVFLLRATDALAAQTVAHWAALAKANGVDPEMIQMAKDQALRMANYRPEETDLPDLPSSPAQ